MQEQIKLMFFCNICCSNPTTPPTDRGKTQTQCNMASTSQIIDADCRRCRFGLIAWLVWIAAIAMPTVAAAQPASIPESILVDSRPISSADSPPADDVWMINTRCITSQSCRANLDSPDFSVSVYDGQHNMVLSDLETLVAKINAEPNTRNVLYAHGNNFQADEVMERAWFVYKQIKSCRKDDVPMRFIIWSWPSQPETTPLKDVRLKAERTDAQGLYMALFLRQIATSQPPITLVGYSFGGRVVTGAVHALAGGSLGGRIIPGQHSVGLNVHLGLVAPALDNDWLMDGKYHGRATKNVDRIALMYNPRDQILRRYWILQPSEWSRALGQAGAMRFGTRLDGSYVPVESYNCSRVIGRRHEEKDYYSRECGAGCVMARLAELR